MPTRSDNIVLSCYIQILWTLEVSSHDKKLVMHIVYVDLNIIILPHFNDTWIVCICIHCMPVIILALIQETSQICLQVIIGIE